MALPGTDIASLSRKNEGKFENQVLTAVDGYHSRYKLYMKDGIEANNKDCFKIATAGSEQNIVSQSCNANTKMLCQFECFEGNGIRNS